MKPKKVRLNENDIKIIEKKKKKNLSDAMPEFNMTPEEEQESSKQKALYNMIEHNRLR